MILLIASITNHTVRPHMTKTDVRAPKISALWYPKDIFLLAYILESLIAIILITKPETSEKIWAASDIMAKLLAKYPPTT